MALNSEHFEVHPFDTTGLERVKSLQETQLSRRRVASGSVSFSDMTNAAPLTSRPILCTGTYPVPTHAVTSCALCELSVSYCDLK